MQLLHDARSLDDIPASTAVTIGMFDGVHRGHQALIGRTLSLASERGIAPLVLTFDRHADEVLRPEKARPYVTTLAEKVALIRSLGISLVVVAKVTPAFLATPAREFATRTLHEKLHASALVIGPDFRFGQGRQGDVTMLRSLQAKLGFTVDLIDPLEVDGAVVSSTRIRHVLAAGEVEQAQKLLGRPYRLSGEVVHGEEIGRTLGFPTANVAYPTQKVLPALGVYLCRASVEDKRCGAAVSVGRRPTFDGTRITVEAHLLEPPGDLYGKTLSLDFLRRIRQERKFGSSDELRAQIAADVARASEEYAGLPPA